MIKTIYTTKRTNEMTLLNHIYKKYHTKITNLYTFILRSAALRRLCVWSTQPPLQPLYAAQLLLEHELVGAPQPLQVKLRHIIAQFLDRRT
jgi:hypothetical protein